MLICIVLIVFIYYDTYFVKQEKLQLQIEAQKIMNKRLEDKKIPDDGKKKTDASATAARNNFCKYFHKWASVYHPLYLQ